jgi:hypothetical protein
MNPEEFTKFLARWLRLATQSCRRGALIYSCMDWRHIGELLDAAKSEGLGPVNPEVAPDFRTTGLIGESLLRKALNGAEHDEDETED